MKRVDPLGERSGYYGEGYGVNDAKCCILAISRLENILRTLFYEGAFKKKKLFENFSTELKATVNSSIAM